MMFKKNLLYIESEIKKVSSDVMEMSVRNKLDISLKKYSDNLDETFKYLVSQNMATIINFIKKDKEKNSE